MTSTDHRDRACPQSATHFGVCLAGLGVGLLLLWVLGWQHARWARLIPYTPLIPCLGVVVAVAACERLWPALRAPSATALSNEASRPVSFRRVGVRLWGLIATLALVAVTYWLLPEYRGTFYKPYWDFIRTIAPLGLLTPAYFCWMDRRMGDTCDDYYEFGRLALGGWREASRAKIARHLLGWTVKAFFLPLMTVYLSSEIESLYGAFQVPNPQSVSLFQVFYHLSYTLDLLFCVIGYTATLRIFDTQIRSVDQTGSGWIVALICYQPFYSVIGRYYLHYDDGVSWSHWLQSWPVVQTAWGALIVMLAMTYSLSTAAYGLRFSNLTHRGIITSGPYRFTKHPAYLAKNLSWWLIAVPFVSAQGWSAATRNCCLLGLLNLVYYARARTEERHLSRDPAYVAYALWMNHHGLLRSLVTIFPFMRYRASESSTMHECALGTRARVVHHPIHPAVIAANATHCALLRPRATRGLSFMNSTRKRATPDQIK
jgi:protein-S-isoprenylcysteine O-methyltransferase Ste14